MQPVEARRVTAQVNKRMVFIFILVSKVLSLLTCSGGQTDRRYTKTIVRSGSSR